MVNDDGSSLEEVSLRRYKVLKYKMSSSQLERNSETQKGISEWKTKVEVISTWVLAEAKGRDKTSPGE